MKGPTASKNSGQFQGEILAQTLMFGGFGQGSSGEAEINWLAEKLKEMKAEPAKTTYYKGDNFKGILFAKFGGAEVAAKAVDIVAKKKLVHEECDIQCQPEAPVEVRAIRTLLLGLRRQLNEWGSLNKSIIRLDI